jgi:hypothetical protein
MSRALKDGRVSGDAGESSAMNSKSRLDGRKCVLAQAALATLNERESREREIAAVGALAPMSALLRDTRRGAIRLIDLERRARFSRLAF